MSNISLLLIITMTVVRTGACPFMCKCYSYAVSDHGDFHADSKCDEKTLAEVLQNKTVCLQVMNVSSADIESAFDLVTDDKQKLCLVKLKISSSDLSENITLSKFDIFQTLDLSGNFIENLTEVFNFRHLRQLDLSHNKIKIIDVGVFGNLISLKALNISSNEITQIEVNSFNGLPNLTSLDLSKNNLSSISNGVFEPLVSLQILNLSSNKFDMLNEQSFRNLTELQQLDVSENILTQVSPAIHLPSLTSLILNSNPKLGLSQEPYMLLVTGRHLQTVDASRTGLKQVPAAYIHSIKVLKLRDNSIKIVQRGDVDSYPLLQLLNFESNGMNTIEYDALGRLNELKYLYLSCNNFTAIPRSLPENLEELRMDHNSIQNLYFKDFEGLHKLQTLSLSDNNIQHVDSNVVKGIGNLLTLDLSNNPLTDLEEDCFKESRALRTLRLSKLSNNNSITEKGLLDFFSLSDLTHIDFSESSKLANITLNTVSTLTELGNLYEICLPFTNMDYVSRDLLYYLPKLRILHFSGNKLNCSRSQTLRAWMRQRSINENSLIRCINSSKLQQGLLITLPSVLNYTENSFNDDNVSREFTKLVTSSGLNFPTSPPGSLRNDIFANTSRTASEEDKGPEMDYNNNMSAKKSSLFSYDVETNDIDVSRIIPAMKKSSKLHETNSGKSIYVKIYSISKENNNFNTTNKKNSPILSQRIQVQSRTDYIFQSTLLILLEVMVGTVIIASFIIIRIIKRRKDQLLANQQELELFNPSGSHTELW